MSPKFLACTLAFVPMLAAAQQAPLPAASAPSGPTEADITRDTPCGAPGVGRVWSGERAGQVEYRDGTPGVMVGASGYWASGCKMPPPPKDCPEWMPPAWRGETGWRICYPAKAAPLRGRDVGQEWSVYTSASGPGANGMQRWRCERGADGRAAWTLVKGRCGR